MKRQDNVIVYERLNIWTLLHAMTRRAGLDRLYFIDFSRFVKKHCKPLVKKLKLKQLHNITFLSRGVEHKTSESAIMAADELVKENPGLAEPLIRYVDDKRAASLIRLAFVQSVFASNKAYRFIILREFATAENEKSLIHYFPVSRNLIVGTASEWSLKIVLVKWHLFILNSIRFIKSIGCAIVLITIPFILTLRLAKDQKIKLDDSGDKPEVVKKDLIFFHRFDDVDSEYSRIYRAMYFFNSGILKVSDCLHICLTKPFTREKEDYLKKNGGRVFDYHNQKLTLGRVWRRLFVDYYKCFMPHLYELSFNALASFSAIKFIGIFISNIVKFEAMVELTDIKLAFFETEMGFAHNVFTIIANKRDIRTMTMMHGYGGYCFPNYCRSNTAVNYYLIPGPHYDKYLKHYSPDVDIFYPVGNHEVEDLPGTDKKDLTRFRAAGKRIIGVLANFDWPLFPEFQAWWPMFDGEDAREKFLFYWMPFFRWAARRDDLFLIFKGKHGKEQYSHPFLKDALTEIPRDRYYLDDNMLIKEVIAVSDCVVTSPCDSSCSFSSWSRGVPAVGYELATPFAGVRGYSNYMVAEKPEELIENIEYILNNGLDQSIFEAIRKDHDVRDQFGNKVSLRIKALITRILEDDKGLLAPIEEVSLHKKSC